MIGYIIGILTVTLFPWIVGWFLNRHTVIYRSDSIGQCWYAGLAALLLLSAGLFGIAILGMIVSFIADLVNNLI